MSGFVIFCASMVVLAISGQFFYYKKRSEYLKAREAKDRVDEIKQKLKDHIARKSLRELVDEANKRKRD